MLGDVQVDLIEHQSLAVVLGEVLNADSGIGGGFEGGHVNESFGGDVLGHGRRTSR